MTGSPKSKCICSPPNCLALSDVIATGCALRPLESAYVWASRSICVFLEPCGPTRRGHFTNVVCNWNSWSIASTHLCNACLCSAIESGLCCGAGVLTQLKSTLFLYFNCWGTEKPCTVCRSSQDKAYTANLWRVSSSWTSSALAVSRISRSR